MNSNPLDVAGAGDSMLISSAMSISCGATPWEAACIGSIAASVQVSRVGNIPLKNFFNGSLSVLINMTFPLSIFSSSGGKRIGIWQIGKGLLDVHCCQIRYVMLC